MKLEAVLRHRNLEEKVYACDVEEWLGEDTYRKMTWNEKKEIQDKLTELGDRIHTYRKA